MMEDGIVLKSESHPTEADSCPEGTADILQYYSHTCDLTHTELEKEVRIELTTVMMQTCDKTGSGVGKSELCVLFCPPCNLSNWCSSRMT